MGFNPDSNSSLRSLALQADGKILVGGAFTSIGGQGRSYIARLNVDGTPDDFNPVANGFVSSLAVQVDGKILAGGSFCMMGGESRSKIARLSADEAALQELTVSGDGTTVNWTRSQSSPEVDDVVFEESSDLTVWTPLGVATRISGGWQPSGLDFPLLEKRYIRVRCKTHGGILNGSTSSIESVRQYYRSEKALQENFPWSTFLPAIIKRKQL